jgi:RNA polymerase sigma factor (sigma-70 family)
MNHDEFLVTRRSLVDRLADWKDQKNWQEFFNNYGRLIFNVARKSGLSETEAEEVVQETVITIAKKVDQLKYDPAVGSFKGWVLTITRWRINDQFRKRKPSDLRQNPPPTSDGGQRTDTVERIADPSGFNLEAEWEAEWRRNLLEAALERVKTQVPPKQFQIFDCYVVKNWPAQKVASELRVSMAQVYLARHRVSALVKKEITRLEKTER